MKARPESQAAPASSQQIRQVLLALAAGELSPVAITGDDEAARALRTIAGRLRAEPDPRPRSRTRAEAGDRRQLSRDLRRALDRDALSVVYQPKLQLRQGMIDFAEALVRWRHPERGFVPADQLVALAEETGEIERLTRYVLGRAIADQADLAQRGHVLAINVNLSGSLVADEEFCAWAREACAGAQGQIGLEITETSVFADPERALSNLHSLVDGGVAIAIDDYGSGLSSLSYLKQLPASELKIDKLFVMGLTSSNRDPLIIRSTIDLAHALEMEITAEGVDDPACLALLKVMGCDRAQGFHICVPTALEDLVTFLEGAKGRDLSAMGSNILNRGKLYSK